MNISISGVIVLYYSTFIAQIISTEVAESSPAFKFLIRGRFSFFIFLQNVYCNYCYYCMSRCQCNDCTVHKIYTAIGIWDANWVLFNFNKSLVTYFLKSWVDILKNMISYRRYIGVILANLVSVFFRCIVSITLSIIG